MKKILILKIVILLNIVFLCFKAFSDDAIKILEKLHKSHLLKKWINF